MEADSQMSTLSNSFDWNLRMVLLCFYSFYLFLVSPDINHLLFEV